MNADPDPGGKMNADPDLYNKSSVSDPDPHKDMPPGSGYAWTDVDPDPGGKPRITR